MKIEISEDWCVRKAQHEGDAEDSSAFKKGSISSIWSLSRMHPGTGPS